MPTRFQGEIPLLLQQSVVEKIAELQRRELDFAWEITHPFEEYLLDWRTRIEEYFLRTFVISTRPDKLQHWDFFTARASGFNEFLEPMLDGLDALAADAIETADDAEEDAFNMGALFGRWQLALGGLEDEDEPWPDYEEAEEDMDIEGAGFAERAERWAGIYKSKIATLFGGLIMQAGTLPETMIGLDTLINGYTDHIEQLARNEWYQAVLEGEARAVLPFGAATGMLWLIKDPNACAKCTALNMTITTKIPIKDTHPSCRCIKVPVVKNFKPTPTSLVVFADRHAQRPS